MSTYTGALVVSVVSAIGNEAVTDIDAAYLAAMIARKINEFDAASAGSAMIRVVATITKD